MISEKPRLRPPWWMMVRQVEFGSGVVPLQSVKSGKVDGRSNPLVVWG